MPRTLALGGGVEHQTAGRSDSQGISLGKGGGSDRECGSWVASLGRAGWKPSVAPGAEVEASWNLVLFPLREKFPLSINFKGRQPWGEPVSMGMLAQEVSWEAPSPTPPPAS